VPWHQKTRGVEYFSYCLGGQELRDLAHPRGLLLGSGLGAGKSKRKTKDVTATPRRVFGRKTESILPGPCDEGWPWGKMLSLVSCDIMGLIWEG